MTQRETIGQATLYCGDAMEILPTLAGCCDLGLTDPPYRLTSGGPAGLLGGIFDSSAYANDGQIVPCSVEWEDWPALFYAALAADADAYVMANDKNVSRAQAALVAAGFGFHNLLVWDKRTATANRWYMKNLEFTLYLWKGRARTIRDPGCKQLITLAHKDVSKHPTEKPVPLMELYIVNSTEVGQTVLDPFMGSGTTGVAALRVERRFIGIEKEPRFFDMACERMTAARKQGALFSQVPRHQSRFLFADDVEILSTSQGGVSDDQLCELGY